MFYLVHSLFYLDILIVDINECDSESGNTLCPSDNKVLCQNTLGGYKCVCINVSYTQVEDNKCVSK